MSRTLYVGVLVFLVGCVSPRSHRPPPIPEDSTTNDYIDIQAGWRLTVVTPITKSGAFVVKSVDQRTEDNGITLSAGADLVGYEVAHYIVKAERRKRVRVEFSSAEVTKDGKTEAQPRSIAPLFQPARRANYLRLIYLVRISEADHNMAVVAARQLDALDTITRQVQANPAGCKVSRYASCSWIPEGIAVRAEALRNVNGIEKWVDASR
jgi:hypothetical protein